MNFMKRNSMAVIPDFAESIPSGDPEFIKERIVGRFQPKADFRAAENAFPLRPYAISIL